MTDLDSQLDKARQSVFTDSYPMGLGELTSMYERGDLIIRPPFQRLFRWDENQKSRLIESILIGIPLPSIFVAQDEEGRWELVDGLQRVSTLLQFQGLLEGDALRLRETKYLPALEGLLWESEDSEECLTPAQRRDIRTAKIDVKIVKRNSDPKAKFDLFQRLNSFGSKLSTQEVRNAQLVGVNPEFVEWVSSLATSDAFSSVTRLPQGNLERKYDEELVLRFLYLHEMSDDQIKSLKNFQEGLEEYAINSAMDFSADYKRRKTAVFEEVFSALCSGGEDILGRWDASKSIFKGGFLNSSFEALAVGLGYLVANGLDYKEDLRQCAIDFWSLPELAPRFATGKSTEARLALMVPNGRRVLKA